MNPVEEDAYLMHYGTKFHSGRYPYGSGDNPYQHDIDFLGRVRQLQLDGMSETEIARNLGMSTGQLRAKKTIANNNLHIWETEQVKKLREKGMGWAAIAKEMGFKNESTARSMLREDTMNRQRKAIQTAELLKEQVDKANGNYIDVGEGLAANLNISREKLQAALDILAEQGYNTFGGRVPQQTNPGKMTTIKVLTPPGTPYKELPSGKKVSAAIYDYGKIQQMDGIISYDGGTTFKKAFEFPTSMDSKRLKIRYADEKGPDGHTGIEKDGLVEIRRGVKDLDLGKSNYAQVRILVDGDRYIKGMAVYSDDLPDGVDVVFNTNKSSSKSMRDVLKPVKVDKEGNIDKENPFGSLIKEHGGQSYYTDSNGEERLSLINKRAEEGDWGEWSKKLPSQFLSKQSRNLAQKQLNLAYAQQKQQFDDIVSLTNPTVKRNMLMEFAAGCDSDAVHLKAAALPRQKYQVIIPIPDLKDNEVFAPQFKQGETVALVRFPHAGPFEIPLLKVNNRNQSAANTIGKTAIDAVGINSKVASQLSGADFDGDTVMVIPTNEQTKIVSKPYLTDLGGFDPHGPYEADSTKVDAKGVTHYYQNGKEYHIMTSRQTQDEMGKISNLITDMTLLGADEHEIARAVKHSMVVIDAQKHKLNYTKSYYENDIESLKRAYQGGPRAGAATLISRAKSPTAVDKRQGTPKVNTPGKDWYDPSKPEGALIYKTADNLEYINKQGKLVRRTQDIPKMEKAGDARELISEGHTVMEETYAKYANDLKDLANRARSEAVSLVDIPQSASARATYSEEVKRLKAALETAQRNKPRERQAQLISSSAVEAKKKAYPELELKENRKELAKIKQQELVKARAITGAKRVPIELSEREWEAIQAGAISKTMLNEMYNYIDKDKLFELAMPKNKPVLTTAKKQLIKSYASSGYTVSEIAEQLGVSESTINNYLSGKE